MTTPRATARLQFHAGFTLDDATAQVDYFADLGISHLYASPILQARKGSTHGYDVVDCTRINDELGGEPALRRLVNALRARGMGLILDIVPNHMGIGVENAWWMDVLAKGRESAYAGHFDIEWTAPDPLVRGRVLLPVLGDAYAATLANGDIRLVKNEGGFALAVYDQQLPLSDRSQATLGGFPGDVQAAYDAATDEGRARLDALVERQHYRLVLWKLASDLVNYRRFFDINELAGMRIERTRVFEDTHALIFRLYAEGLIDGVRCDHVDGLANPRRYCRQLRHRLEQLRKQRPAGTPRDAYVIVEKILAADESLREDWRTDGTTGYEFMDEVSAVLHDVAGEGALTSLWTNATGNPARFETYAHAARRQILVDSFESELARTSRALFSAARAAAATRDVSEAAVRRVLIELLVQFPVYRTYVGGAGRDALDEAVFERAMQGARRTVRPEDLDLLENVSQWLGGEAPRQLPPGPVRRARERAIAVFQQATSPVAAKAVEDTAGYRYGRLLSRNEVGADPDTLAIAVDDFHARCERRARDFPRNLLATATHDHKRGEDLRMRLAVLSERTQDWSSLVADWQARHAHWRTDVDGRPAPVASDELMLYQMLLGAWPPELVPDDRDGVAAFAERIAGWQQKALREAKRRTRWTDPNEPYEQANLAFLKALLTAADTDFPHRLHEAVSRFAAAGIANALSQTVLRMTTPGIPDLYQGTEYWDFSLVDPDNRRPVDFAVRRASLAAVTPLAELAAHWRDGRLKQRVVHRLLQLRERSPLLFSRGAYRPIALDIPHAIAFERRTAKASVIVLVARHIAAWLDGAASPLVEATRWGDVTLVLPDGAYRDVLGDRAHEWRGELPLRQAFTDATVVVLERV